MTEGRLLVPVLVTSDRGLCSALLCAGVASTAKVSFVLKVRRKVRRTWVDGCSFSSTLHGDYYAHGC